jgi:hypothetical protein
MRIDVAEWNALDLEAHDLLKDVPLQDVSAIDLPGGGTGRSLEDLRQLLDFEGAGSGGAVVRSLFALRGALGRLFGWDREPPAEAERADSDASRIGDALRQRSLRPPGTRDGPFELLYQLETEMLSEARNATVHAFSCMVLREVEGGHRFYWGVYVAPVSRFTPLYMAAIEPFRRFIVYPSLLRRLRGRWVERFAS